ncbi:hypothetical protein LCGC14_1013700 [marine sediment metagenome]|uniref:Zinc finger CHC2-type domain-containing protein n=1 Tax=marine sediment metagenome TaxID=412755 RepID=A0A0F9NL04_9ZZZZ
MVRLVPEDDLRELKECVDLTVVWGDGKIMCPWHEDVNPSLQIYHDHVYCFSCNTTADGITLAQILHEFSFRQAFSWLTKYKGQRKREGHQPLAMPVDIKDTWEWTRKLEKAREWKWLADRGLGEWIIWILHIGWTGRAFSIPHITDDRVWNVKFRVHPDYQMNGENKYYSMKGQPFRSLYPIDYVKSYFQDSLGLFLTEGEFDAMVLLQAGLPALSLPSGATSNILKWRDTLTKYKVVWLCFDQDSAGQKAAVKAIRRAGPKLLPTILINITDPFWPAAWGKDVTDAREQLVPKIKESYDRLIRLQ